MHEFFQGWRLKAGLVTLAMACLLTSGWVRSYAVTDRIVFGKFHLHTFFSCNGLICWESSEANGVIRLRFDVQSTNRTARLFQEIMWDMHEREEGDDPAWIIPYWSLVLPLTLLSAWLILTKPHPSNSAKESAHA